MANDDFWLLDGILTDFDDPDPSNHMQEFAVLSNFEHPPAGSGSVRLIRIDSVSPIVRVTLEVFPLVSCPQFQAVSYCWDEPVFTKTIICNKKTYKVTPHLLSGLRHISMLCPGSWIFVDAICINQSDNNDKAAQVQQMRSIYQQADKTVVWLGEGDFNAEECYRQFLGVWKLLVVYDQSTGVRQVIRTMANSNSKAPEADKVLEFLISVCHNSWFGRLWVLQEVVLAQEVLLLHGRIALKWTTYDALIRWRHSPNAVGSLWNQTFDDRWRHALGNFTAMRMMFVRDWHKEIVIFRASARDRRKILLLYVVVQLMYTTQVSDCLDRVYAVLGLLDDDLKAKVKVEYSDRLRGQFWVKWLQLFQSILSGFPSMATQIFSLAGDMGRHPFLPSWCPNPDCGTSPFNPSLLLHQGRAGMVPTGVKSEATNGPDITPLPNSLAIQCTGLEIDCVSIVVDLTWIRNKLAALNTADDLSNKLSPQSARLLLATLEKCSVEIATAKTSSSTPRRPNLARCLVANSYQKDLRHDHSRVTQDLNAFMKHIHSISHGIPVTDSSLKPGVTLECWRFWYYFRRQVSVTPIFFITEAGRIGVCSGRPRLDDKLALFMDLHVPFILRPGVGGTYEMMGGAYVDGIMMGEAFQDHDLVARPPRTSTIV